MGSQIMIVGCLFLGDGLGIACKGATNVGFVLLHLVVELCLKREQICCAL